MQSCATAVVELGSSIGVFPAITHEFYIVTMGYHDQCYSNGLEVLFNWLFIHLSYFFVHIYCICCATLYVVLIVTTQNLPEFLIGEPERVAIGDINAASIAGYEQVVANVEIVSSRATRYNSDTYS